MFQRFLSWIREWISKMINPNDVTRALNVDIQVSSDMVNALQTWSDMYENKASWLSDPELTSLNLPATIASEVARLTTLEMKVEVSGSSLATFINSQLVPLIDDMKEHIEYGEAKGGMIFKPYLSGDEVAIDKVHADSFYPVSFDSNKRVTACIFVDKRRIKNFYYTRLEYHSFQKPDYIITNAIFRSTSDSSLGGKMTQTKPISFNGQTLQGYNIPEVPDWDGLVVNVTITNVKSPLFGYFRVPLANNIDSTSPLGVSCYSRAVKQIKNADEIYSNLVWEFESGKRAIYADELAFDRDANGKPAIPSKRLYRTLKASGQISDNNKLFEAWSPEFREASIKSGLNSVLRSIELLCGLAYGSISDPDVEARTATEIKATKQRTYATVTDNQKALQNALDDTIYAMSVWATLGRLAPSGTYNVTYSWDDSIVADHDTQFQQDFQVAGANMMPDYIFLMRNYGLSETDAKKWVAEKQAESAAAMDLFNIAGNNPVNNADIRPA